MFGFLYEQEAGALGTTWEISVADLGSRPVTRTRREAGVYLALFLGVAFIGAVFFVGVWFGGGNGSFAQHVGHIMAGDYVEGAVGNVIVEFLALCIGLGAFCVGAVGSWVAGRVLKQLSFTETTVQFQARSLSGKVKREWVEPLAQYEGVLFKTIRHGRAGDHLVCELHHAEAHKCVQLCKAPVKDSWHAEGGGEFRRDWEAYARVLNLPALEKVHGGQIIRREPGDLDKPVGELVREGKLAPGWRHGMPPHDLRLINDTGDNVCVSFGASHKLRILCFGFLAVFTAIFAIRYYTQDYMSADGMMACLGIAAMVAYSALIFLLENHTPAETWVTITPERIVYQRYNLVGDVIKEDQMDLANLEEIRASGPSSRLGVGLGLPAGLRFIYDAKQVKVRAPSRRAAEWMRGAILTLAGKGR